MKNLVWSLASTLLAVHASTAVAVVVGEDGKVIANPGNSLYDNYTKSDENGKTVYRSKDGGSVIVRGPDKEPAQPASRNPFGTNGGYTRTVENGNTVYRNNHDQSSIVVHGDDHHLPSPENPAPTAVDRCGGMVARLYRGMNAYFATLRKEIARLKRQREDYNATVSKNWSNSNAKNKPHPASLSEFDGILDEIAAIEKAPLPLDMARLYPGDTVLRSNKQMVTRYQYARSSDAAGVPTRTSDAGQLGKFLCGANNEREFTVKDRFGSRTTQVKAKFTLQPEFAYLDGRLSSLFQDLATATDRVADMKPGVDPAAYRKELFRGLSQVRSWVKGVEQSPEVSAIYKSQADGT